MRCVPVRFIALLLLLSSPASGRQDVGLERFPRWFLTDPPSVARSMQGSDFLLAGGSVLLLIPLSLADEPLRRAVAPDGAHSPLGVLRVANELGGAWGIGGSMLILGGTLLTDDETLQNTAFSSFQAAAYAGATALLLKWTTGRSRPGAERGAFHFRPGRSLDDAFPSGHTAVAFALTVPWVRSYPSSPSWLLLAAAAGTGAARIAYDRHWLTDVVGGAILGAGMGFVVSRRRFP